MTGQAADRFVRSKVTEVEPGLTAGKLYKYLRWGVWTNGPYVEIVNDRGEVIAINDPLEYLEDVGNGALDGAKVAANE